MLLDLPTGTSTFSEVCMAFQLFLTVSVTDVTAGRHSPNLKILKTILGAQRDKEDERLGHIFHCN